MDSCDQLRHIVRRNGIAGDIGGDDLGCHLEDVSFVDCGQHRLFHRFTRSLVGSVMVRVIEAIVTQ